MYLARYASLYAALFLSGTAALIYQATWGRMLYRVFGVGDLAIATVLAAFFLGLGLGSAWGGRFVQRRSRPALTYAVFEFGIGAYALLSLLIIPNIHLVYSAFAAGASFTSLTVVRFLLAMAILLPPTVLMGATLPVLVKVVARTGGDWSRSATWLYATNTLGAMTGAGITGLYLVPQFGARLSVVIAAVSSFVAGAVVLVLWRGADRWTEAPAEPPGAEDPNPAAPSPPREAPASATSPSLARSTDEDPDPGLADAGLADADLADESDDAQAHASLNRDAASEALSSEARSSNAPPSDTLSADTSPPAEQLHPDKTGLPLALALASIAGFAALASEVLWTRVLRIIVQGTTPAFSAMLVNYLLGIALGSLIAARLLQSRASAARIFGWTQIILATLTALAMLLTPQLPRILGLLQEGNSMEPHETWIVLVLSLFLLFPLALALGTSIPLAWRIAGGDARDAPKRAGRVLAWNTVGGLLGSIAAGFLMVPSLGIEASIIIVLMIHALASAIAFYAAARPHGMIPRVAALVGPAILVALVLNAQPSIEVPFLLHARNDPLNGILLGPGQGFEEGVVFMREGRNTTVTVLEGDALLRLYNDGRPESGFGGSDPGFGSELAMLGASAGLFADERERAMIVGLGAGHTATMALAGGFSHVDVVELESAVVEAARYLHEAREKPFPLDDPRARLIVDDARAQLVLAEPGSYDAIISQPSHPWLAGSSALYTREFFREAKDALRDGGVLCLWVNLFRTEVRHLRSVAATLLTSFEHVQAFVVEDSSFILIASDTPMPIDDEIARRVATEEFRPYLSPLGLDDVLDIAAVREIDPPGMPTFAEGASVIVDDRPAFEFELATTSASASIYYEDIDRAAWNIPWVSPASFAAFPEDDQLEIVLVRLQEVANRPTGIRRVKDALPNLPLEPSPRAYLEGAVAEAQGDIRGALAGYDASDLAVAATAADELRYDERAYHRLLRRVSERTVLPFSARPALSAALGLEHRGYAQLALDLAKEVEDPGDATLVQVLEAWLLGCPQLLGAEALGLEATADEHVAFAAERCAFEVGDTRAARNYAELRMRQRRSVAVNSADLGKKAQEGGNNAAARRYYRRALMANPAHGPAAASLAILLSDADRAEEAETVLRDALRAAEGLPSSTSAIQGAAAQLGITL
ncbi:MAG: fused MFS/spermidine synthase [Myxococcota bacterium]